MREDPVEFASTTNKVLLYYSPENTTEIFTPTAHANLFSRKDAKVAKPARYTLPLRLCVKLFSAFPFPVKLNAILPHTLRLV